MLNIDSSLVKNLRERSGVGMSKCKEALIEADGDIEKAAEILRKKGLASSVKKEGRETTEGTIVSFESKDAISMVEVNSETDFVAKNDKFQKFVKELAMQAAKTKPASVEAFLKQKSDADPSLTVDEYRNIIIQTIGENVKISRLQIIFKNKNASYGIYSHMNGKILVVTEVMGSESETALAKDISMQVAAESPEYLSENDVPENVKAKEMDIAKAQVLNKPAAVVDKIVQGKMKAYYDQVCLLNQKYIKDNLITISQLLEKRSKEIGKNLKVASFFRWHIS